MSLDFKVNGFLIWNSSVVILETKNLNITFKKQKGYFYCKDSVVYKQLCPDRQLFEDESKGCKEFKDVYCGERPVNDKGQDQCRLRPNGGTYINYEILVNLF